MTRVALIYVIFCSVTHRELELVHEKFALAQRSLGFNRTEFRSGKHAQSMERAHVVRVFYRDKREKK